MTALFLIKRTNEILREDFGTNSDDEPYDHFLGYTTVSSDTRFHIVTEKELEEIQCDVAESCDANNLHSIQMVATMDEDDLPRIIQALTDHTKQKEPFHIGDYVNAVGTAWEFGHITTIDGELAYVRHQFGDLRGEAIPVPMSQLRRA